jgi:hypothetical protein
VSLCNDFVIDPNQPGSDNATFAIAFQFTIIPLSSAMRFYLDADAVHGDRRDRGTFLAIR